MLLTQLYLAKRNETREICIKKVEKKYKKGGKQILSPPSFRLITAYYFINFYGYKIFDIQAFPAVVAYFIRVQIAHLAFKTTDTVPVI